MFLKELRTVLICPTRSLRPPASQLTLKIKSAVTILAPAEAEKNIKNATAANKPPDRFLMVSRLRNFLLAVFSAALLALPFHFDHLGFLAFFAFVPYFFMLDSTASSGAFKYSYFFGFFFFCFLGYWLTYVNLLGFFLLSAYLAFYFAFFGLAAAKFLNPSPEFEKNNRSAILKTLFFLPAFWVALEYIRGWMIGGLPWALLGYSQWKHLPFIQIADITGAYGVSYFVLFANLLLYYGIRIFFAQTLEKKRILTTLTLFLLGALIVVGGYGMMVLCSREDFYKSSENKAVFRVSVLQGSIPQEEKWDAKIKNIIFEKYKRLTLMSAVEKSDLIVWPETSFPGYLEDEVVMAAQLRNVIRQSRTMVLVGAPTFGDLEKGLRFYNSAVLYGPQGEERQRYNKIHLVPFGEYVPFEPILRFIRKFVQIGHFTAGQEATIFKAVSRYQKVNIRVKFAALICYEDIFPGLVRDSCNHGADFLVNMTNDAWFGKTAAPYQHAQASVFRAVENRVNVVRATNTGLSCFILPEGKIAASVSENGEEIFVTGHKGYDLLLKKEKSFYTRFGDVFALFCFILCFAAYKDRSKRKIYARI